MLLLAGLPFRRLGACPAPFWLDCGRSGKVLGAGQREGLTLARSDGCSSRTGPGVWPRVCCGRRGSCGVYRTPGDGAGRARKAEGRGEGSAERGSEARPWGQGAWIGWRRAVERAGAGVSILTLGVKWEAVCGPFLSRPSPFRACIPIPSLVFAFMLLAQM